MWPVDKFLKNIKFTKKIYRKKNLQKKKLQKIKFTEKKLQKKNLQKKKLQKIKFTGNFDGQRSTTPNTVDISGSTIIRSWLGFFDSVQHQRSPVHDDAQLVLADQLIVPVPVEGSHFGLWGSHITRQRQIRSFHDLRRVFAFVAKSQFYRWRICFKFN